MKSLVRKLAALLTLVLFFAGVTVAKEVTKNFKVTGMVCGACQAKVEKALGKTEGVKSAQVDWNKGSAAIVYDDEKVTAEKISKTIEEQGFKVEQEKEKK